MDYWVLRFTQILVHCRERKRDMHTPSTMSLCLCWGYMGCLLQIPKSDLGFITQLLFVEWFGRDLGTLDLPEISCQGGTQCM